MKHELCIQALWWTSFSLALLALFSVTTIARAEAVPLTLRAALERARITHPDLAVLRAQVESQRRVLTTAQRAFVPTLTGSTLAGLDHSDRPNLAGLSPARSTATLAHIDGSAQLDMVLMDFGKRRHVVAAERAGLFDSQQQHAEGERAISLATAELFVTLLSDRALVREAQRSLTRQEALLHAVEALVEGQQRPRVDAQRIAVEVEATRDAVRVAEAVAERDRALLASALGLSLDAELLLEPLDSDAISGPKTSLEALSTALHERPSLRSVEAKNVVAHERATAAGRALLPVLSARGTGFVRRDWLAGGLASQGRQEAWGASTTLTVKLDSVALADRRRLESDADVAARRVQSERRDVEQETLLSHHEVERSQAALSLADHVIKGAEVTLTAQRRRYELGAASLLELLDAEGLLSTATTQRVQAELDLQLAHVRLLASCGVLEQRLANAR